MKTIKISGMEVEILENGYLKLVDEKRKIQNTLKERDDKINSLAKRIEKLMVDVTGNISTDNITIGNNVIKLNGNGTITIINGTIQSDRQVTSFIDGFEVMSQTEKNLYIRNK